jgi:hypothetical protein
MAGIAPVAQGQIPYPNSGTENPITYTFTAVASGHIDAYFAGSGAAYDEVLGMLVNGVPTGITGLDDHTSNVGDVLNLGNVNAGDTLTFFINVLSPALGMVYSDPSLNGGYDAGIGHNHVYSTAYSGTGLGGGIPAGTYVGFEDLPNYSPPDWNYFDETYVFSDVATHSSAPDAASSLGLLSMGIAGLGLLRRRLCS